MDITKGFYDLCVPYTTDKLKLQNIVKELIELGYRTCAIDQVYDHTKKDQAKRAADIFPEPVNLDFLKEFENKIKILKRLTIIYSDVAVAHGMTNSSNVKKYNIIAGQPKGESAWNHCCTTFNGDILCFNPDDSKFLVNRKTYQVAVKRGLYFEIKYSHAITNSSNRKDMIRITHNYHSKGKSKNIIFSSGATSPFELRGPYDISNLALIFGLSEEQGKSAISSLCRLLLLKAESRRIGKTVMFVKNQGPIVFSSSSEDEDESEESDAEMDTILSLPGSDELVEHPHKKKKLC